ncbi:MAG TPA: hypothetical protein V6D19_01005 [Stenomitos sp.]
MANLLRFSSRVVLISILAIAPFCGAMAQSTHSQVLAQANTVDTTLPETVRQAVLTAASTQAKLPIDQLSIRKATPKIWSDGCLGLGPVGQMCTAVLVEGWEVTVTHQRQEWVYRTNASGQIVRYDPAGGRLSQLVPPPAEQIPSDQRPEKLDKKVIFREIKTGGFAGLSQEISLYKDGRLVSTSQGRPPGSGDNVTTSKLSKAEIKAFKKQLEQLHFGQFNGLRYPGPRGAADYFVVTLRNGSTTVQYADINVEALPQDLQKVIQAWEAIKNANRG